MTFFFFSLYPEAFGLSVYSAAASLSSPLKKKPLLAHFYIHIDPDEPTVHGRLLSSSSEASSADLLKGQGKEGDEKPRMSFHARRKKCEPH